VEDTSWGVKGVHSSRLVPIKMGKRASGTMRDRRSGMRPPGPSMTGWKEDTFADVIDRASRMVCESAERRQSKLSLVFAERAQAGTAATNSSQASSLCSGPKIGPLTTDSRIWNFEWVLRANGL